MSSPDLYKKIICDILHIQFITLQDDLYPIVAFKSRIRQKPEPVMNVNSSQKTAKKRYKWHARKPLTNTELAGNLKNKF